MIILMPHYSGHYPLVQILQVLLCECQGALCVCVESIAQCATITELHYPQK